MCLEYDLYHSFCCDGHVLLQILKGLGGWYGIEGSEQHWHWQQSVESELLVGDEASDLVIVVSPLIVLPVEVPK